MTRLERRLCLLALVVFTSALWAVVLSSCGSRDDAGSVSCTEPRIADSDSAGAFAPTSGVDGDDYALHPCDVTPHTRVTP